MKLISILVFSILGINIVKADSIGKLEIYYIDTMGNYLDNIEILEGNIGSDYNIYPKEIEGYSLVRVDGEEIGVFSYNTKELYYMYDKDIYLEADNINTGISIDIGYYLIIFIILVLIGVRL